MPGMCFYVHLILVLQKRTSLIGSQPRLCLCMSYACLFTRSLQRLRICACGHAAHVLVTSPCRQLEDLQRSAQQQTLALQRQVAEQAAQLAALAQQRQRAEAELRKQRTREQVGKRVRNGRVPCSCVCACA